MPAIYKRKDRPGFFWVDARDIGRGRMSIKGRDKAREELESLERDADADLTREGASVTLAGYYKRWDARMEAAIVGGKEVIAPSTLDSYREQWERHLLPRLGAVPVKKINAGAIRDLLATKGATGLSKNSVRLIRASLSVVLSDAVADRLIPSNPCFDVKGGSGRRAAWKATRDEQRRRVRPFTLEQLFALLRIADEKEPRFAPLFWVSGLAGLRPGEALALRWRDISLEGRTILVGANVYEGVRRETTKTREARTVDMNKNLQTRLRLLLAERKKAKLAGKSEEVPEYIAANRDGGFLDNNNAASAFRRCLAHAGEAEAKERGLVKKDRAAILAGWRAHTPYDLRHTFATLLLASGAPLAYVSAQLGHAKPTTTLAWYVHWIPTEKSQTYVDRLDLTGTAVPAPDDPGARERRK